MSVHLHAPTYDELQNRFPEEQRRKFYECLKWFGKEGYGQFDSAGKMTAQKVHAAVWRAIVAELMMAEIGIEFHSRVCMVGYHGEPQEFQILIRVENLNKNTILAFFWNVWEVTIGELPDEAGDELWVLYSPPPSDPPIHRDF